MSSFMEVGCTNHSYLKLNHQILLSHLRCVCRNGGSKFSRLSAWAGEGEGSAGSSPSAGHVILQTRLWSLAERVTRVAPAVPPPSGEPARKAEPGRASCFGGRQRAPAPGLWRGAAGSSRCIASIFGRRESLVNPMCTFYKFLMFTYFYIL